ncbi:hypothetical protein CF647_14535 [Burkholderia sp. 117]|nr:hypothetical protein CF649_14495 [Burkholderia sp. 136(2017)]PNX16580.1 hypothetical protein CF650_06910 [Burkholderia sp. 129]PNX29032.1 hypothetical protein CF647_14535 [Burkholderia sp. 117]PNX38253.1 hypothetical protein CF648_14500 [Burkholderia sp. 137]
MRESAVESGRFSGAARRRLPTERRWNVEGTLTECRRCGVELPLAHRGECASVLVAVIRRVRHGLFAVQGPFKCARSSRLPS